MQCLPKHENVVPSQKDNCHSVLAEFGIDKFFNRTKDEDENILSKPLDSFSFEPIRPFQLQYKNTNQRNTKTVLQQSAHLNDTVLTDSDDIFEKKIPQTYDRSSPDLRLISISSTSEKYMNSENENLQL